MARALQLAYNGEGYVSPNPMVGAVIADQSGRIIGEGWHRVFGGPHAEVNAYESVRSEDRPLLKSSTVFVTLEPCSHYGKTPPCVDLLIHADVKRVVIGCTDPFHKVDGTGIQKLKEAGIEVVTGILEKECLEINRKFFFAHRNNLPFVTLKWAQSSDGWMDSLNEHPYKFSSETGSTLVHRLRANHDAIITSTSTVMVDNPRLDVRFWKHGRNPKKVILGQSKIQDDRKIYEDTGYIKLSSRDLRENLKELYSVFGITSVLIEAGPTLLSECIRLDLWNDARIEINPVVLGKVGTAKAPEIKGIPYSSYRVGQNVVYEYRRQ